VFFAGAAICWRRQGPKRFTGRIWNAQFPNRALAPALTTKPRRRSRLFLRVPHASGFFSATTKLHMRQSSPPIQTRLGFHIVQLTDSKPVQQLPFDQARAEIAAALESEQRQHAVEALIVDLCTGAKWFGAAHP
jgi:hypothetical protein